jgi:hypothetical protein
MKPSKVSKRVFSSNVINSSSSAVLEKFEGDIEVIETENKFVLWCKISSKLMKLNSDLLLGIVYIPPEYSR